jgi:hypothetical protein
LTVAGIYGPNASGKSNALRALQWLRDAINRSVRYWDESIPIETFAFGEGPHSPSGFTLELLVNGIRYEYVVELNRQEISYEGLFHYPEKKRRRVFERERHELVLQRGLGDLAGTRQLLTDRTLALSAARRFDEPLVSDFASMVSRIHTRGLGFPHGPGSGNFGNWIARPTESWLDPENSPWVQTDVDEHRVENDRKQAVALLRMADLGVEDVVYDEEQVTRPSGRESTRRRPRLIHRTSAETAPLDFEAESAGTQNWYRLIGPLLSVLRSGSILLLDEIDASLHSTLSSQLINLFHDPATNPRGAQLIFTTHDTSLLNHLNRDEVWLTEKRPSGATRLGALAEFAGERVRKSKNLENAYLHGRFGALPDVDRAELLQALGLIG